MKVGLAQINSWLGDFAGNRKKMLQFIQKSQSIGCDLVVFPEASLFGYHPCDLLERPSVVRMQLKELSKLSKQIPQNIGVFVGAITNNQEKKGKPYLNAAVFLEKGKKPKIFAKQLLPTYDVFDESRHIEPGKLKNNVLKWRGKRLLITICEDIWAWPQARAPRFATYNHNPLKDVSQKIDLIINLSASPFTETKLKKRQGVVQTTARHFKAPMVYVNMVGAQDELIFDGGSFVVDSQGKIVAQCGRFVEDFQTIQFDDKKIIKPNKVLKLLDQPSHKVGSQREALVLGLKDFVIKNGFSQVHLGLSGGIDSAVVACLAVEALGSENVNGMILPGPFSHGDSSRLAQQLAQNLGVQTTQFDISPLYYEFISLIERVWGEIPFGIVHENLQARLRGIFLMAHANKNKSLLLATSNKSELATGYSTLYGDMCGAIMPLGDLLKGEVYQLAESYKIPQEIINRAPTAELRPNQKDEDTLGSYEQLDQIIVTLVGGLKPAKSKEEKRVLQLLMGSEFKRWQSPPILKISDHAFGRGRRLPLAHRGKF
ncbi:MAG: NAD+ synthase [Bdellovibrionales bacterium]|nr:NAD+ synthase [Bdellovibrionales bacterium]